MPVSTVITDLSTTAAANYPQGTDSPSTLDDQTRALGKFIRELHTGAVTTTAQITAGTINGATVGATTPSTGAFTTLSASTSVTAGLPGTPAPYYWNYSSNVNSRTWKALNDVSAYGDWKLQVSTTQTGSTYQDVLTASSTGLSITGALSATGTTNLASGSVNWTRITGGVSADYTTISAEGETNTFLKYSVKGTAGLHNFSINNSIVGLFSATGLAVTGTTTSTAATNVITANTTSATGPVGLLQGQRSGVAKGYVGIDGSDNFGLFDNAGTARATVNTTGLAVTGTVSAIAATPTLTLTATAANNPVVTLADNAGRTAIFSGPTSPGIDYARVGTTSAHNLSLITNNTVQATVDTAGRLSVPNGTVVAPVAFASLPAAPVAGQRAMINNSVAAPAFLSAAAGGGSTTVPVFYNGTAWLVG